MRHIKNNSKKQGFTLIELLVSIALFSVVLTITLGSILTIADANKKARSLMSVMNNLNFAVDSITRSFKTGVITPNSDPVSNSLIAEDSCLTTEEIDYVASSYPDGRFVGQEVTYCLEENSRGNGTITKDGTELTSPDVDVDYLKFDVAAYSQGEQPIVNIMLEGTVKVSEKIRSNFSIQTSVSQRQLNI